MNAPRKIRVAEAVRQAQLPITAEYARRLIVAGRVPGERIGHLWYCTPEALRAALVHQQGAP